MAVVPRGEWCHIAVVASAPPKKRVTFYINGHSAGHVDHVKYALPMREIGDRESCFHGALLEVRCTHTITHTRVFGKVSLQKDSAQAQLKACS